MILYLDTSALVKLYVKEPHSNEVRSLVQKASLVATHVIAYPEARAGFAKAWRMGRISDDVLTQLVVWLDEGWGGFDVISVDEPLARRAGVLADTFGLRGYDSVHLAAAEKLAAGAGDGRLCFVCFDTSLTRAAEGLGLKTPW